MNALESTGPSLAYYANLGTPSNSAGAAGPCCSSIENSPVQALQGLQALQQGGVAQRVGYSDPTNFTRAFRKWTGVSPSAYRAQHRLR
jgi:hypothetical protein